MNDNDASARKDRVFLGHPAGLGWLSASEFWERFSYYGMQALLVLYLSKWLLQPGHIEHVWGMAPFRRAMVTIYGANSTETLAIAITAFYASWVYGTPILGGLLADRVLGRTRTVILGATLMAVGQFFMMTDQTFLIAISCLLVGVGCFKGNIASQVGDLYTQDDPRRADGFQIYFLGIQVAVIVAPFVCSNLGEKIDWRLGFGAAGIAMALGLIVYLLGRKNYPPEAVRKVEGHEERPKLERRDWQVIAILIVLLPILACSAVGNQQIFAGYLIWSEKYYDMHVLGFDMPIGMMLSVDAVVSTILMIGVIAFWRWWGRHWKEPDELTKIAIGTFISALAPLTLAAISAGGHRVSLAWALPFHIINDLGFSNVFPVGLALYSRAAPKGLGGVMIAVYYLHLLIGNTVTGRIGALLDQVPAPQFWLIHVVTIGVSGVLLVFIKIFFGRTLAPAYDHLEPT